MSLNDVTPVVTNSFGTLNVMAHHIHGRVLMAPRRPEA
jgi:hypothetical protein